MSLFELPALDRAGISRIEDQIRNEAVFDGKWTAEELATVQRVFLLLYGRLDEMFEEKVRIIREMQEVS